MKDFRAWKDAYIEGASEEERSQREREVEVQLRLDCRIRTLFEKGLPEWVSKDFVFPVATDCSFFRCTI